LRKLYSLSLTVLGLVACIGIGSVAAGLLYDEFEEHHPLLVGLFLLVALAALAGAFFCLFRFLKQIAPKS
jgi:hypothetical protein